MHRSIRTLVHCKNSVLSMKREREKVGFKAPPPPLIVVMSDGDIDDFRKSHPLPKILYEGYHNYLNHDITFDGFLHIWPFAVPQYCS